jgi:hypothetical protein
MLCATNPKLRIPQDLGIDSNPIIYQALARCEELSRRWQKEEELREEAQNRQEALLQETRQREEAQELRFQEVLSERDVAVAELTASAIKHRVSKRDAYTDAGVRTAEKVSQWPTSTKP